MLVLSRTKEQRIFIGDDIIITICDVDRGVVRVGIQCPLEMPIYREEVKMKIEREERDRKPNY